jgi:hypothetical protein
MRKRCICPDRRESATLPFTLKANLAATIAVLALALLILPVEGSAAGNDKLNVFVDCHCSDAVGGQFCSDLKDKVKDSEAYRLVDHPDGFGIAVHLWCMDLFTGLPGIDSKLSGTMSAVSVAFTIFADRLPGEVYEDSSVFRVGKDAADEMSQRILSAVGQLYTANKTVFEHMRVSPTPVATPTQEIIQ